MLSDVPTWEIVAGIIVAVTAFWQRVRHVVVWLFGLVVVTRRCEPAVSGIVMSYLAAKKAKSWSSVPVYGTASTYVRSLDRVARVCYKMFPYSGRFYWFRGRPLAYDNPSIPNTERNAALTESNNTFSFIRGTINFEKLMLEAVAWADNVEENIDRDRSGGRYQVVYHTGSINKRVRDGFPRDNSEEAAVQGSAYVLNPVQGFEVIGFSRDDLGEPRPVSSLDELSLPPHVLSVIEEIRFWHTSKKWYEERGVPWRRGYVFHGPPGTGKTSTARAVAQSLDLPIHVFDLSSMTNNDLREAWKKMLAKAPCMVLLEDLDCIFSGRTNVTNVANGLSFEGLLNCLDGVERVHGVLLVVSTNNLEELDEALVNRPGRIDELVLFPVLDREGKVKLATRVLGDRELAERMADEGISESAAVFQERCFKAALASRFVTKEGPFR